VPYPKVVSRDANLISSCTILHPMLDSNIHRSGTEKPRHTKMTGGTAPSGQASLPTANSTKSFWHSDPSKTLLGHRTTAALPTQANIVIIGSGISGSCAAHFLRQDDRGKGLDIVMLEAREACWGATGRVSDISPFPAARSESLISLRTGAIVLQAHISYLLIGESLSYKTSRLWKRWSWSTIFCAIGEVSLLFTHLCQNRCSTLPCKCTRRIQKQIQE
jgi:FAD dependent oxidoreductase